MSKAKPVVKTPVIEKVAELGMKLRQRHLADYAATTSRNDFTQRQLKHCLILRAYLKTTYRRVLELLAVSPPLPEQLGRHKRPRQFHQGGRETVSAQDAHRLR